MNFFAHHFINGEVEASVWLGSVGGLSISKREGVVATFRRITPLGLTDQEAVGWYRNNVRKNWFSRFVFASVSGVLLGIVGAFENVPLESSLATGMILQYFIFVLVGILFAYAGHSVVSSGSSVRLFVVYESALRKASLVSRYGVLPFCAAGLIMCYWALPSSCDAALSSSLIQSMMRLSFGCAGVLVLAGSMCVSSHTLAVLSIAVGKVMGLFGAFLILSPTHLYDVYPVAQQAETGVIMIAIMTFIDMAIIPCWLYKYFTSADHMLAHVT